ncbi:urease accessory protein [Rhodoligotrophos appendicifer]|uniref:urease accessory protein UreD n=1 Tax=Rhodoligotrophos appendicifer TaxID=987056 RepID=UPI001184E882|nr:urease accessory protein UreD [Rhodoligotrophos appendicifer]
MLNRLSVPAPPTLQRASGEVRLCIEGAMPASHASGAYQQGSLKVRFPRLGVGGFPEAVLINTAGGVTGGDVFKASIRVAESARAVVTTQAAERVYRSMGGDAHLDVSLEVGEGARLDWLPQETILFDGGCLSRTLDVTLAETAEALLCESIVLGRTASGETVRGGSLVDRWRIRRGGRLVYADTTRLGGAVDVTGAGAAVLDGNLAFASLVWVGGDVQARLERARALLVRKGGIGGASVWNGLLAVRMVAATGSELRQRLCEVLEALEVSLPRVWRL